MHFVIALDLLLLNCRILTPLVKRFANFIRLLLHCLEDLFDLEAEMLDLRRRWLECASFLATR